MASMEPKRVLKPVNSASQVTSLAEQQLSQLKKLKDMEPATGTTKPTRATTADASSTSCDLGPNVAPRM